MMFRRMLLVLTPALLLAACNQPSSSAPPSSANRSEDVPWSYTAPEGGTTDPSLGALSLDPGNNTLGFEPLLSATNGYGPFETNTSNGEAAKGDGKPMTLNGMVYQKGFGVHSNGTLVYSLQNTQGAICSIFQAKIGVDDEVGNNGSVVFQVLTGATPATATVAYDSGVMTGASATKSINVNVIGAKVLMLRVTDAGDGSYFDHADWARPTIACAPAASPTAGSKDDGFVTTGFGTTGDLSNIPKATALQPDGKILGFGVTTNTANFFVQRLDQDGNLDSSFVNRGPTVIAGSAQAIVTYPDGRILVLGRSGSLPKPVPGYVPGPFLYRMLPDGNTDLSFGNGGTVGFPGHQFLSEGSTLALQPDGKILIGGSASHTVFLRRLLSNGQKDASFGMDGKVTTPVNAVATSVAYTKTIAVQSDGKVLVGGGVQRGPEFTAGSSSAEIVVRYTTGGTLDSSFGNQGVLTIFEGPSSRSSASISALIPLPDGSLLAAGGYNTGDGASCILYKLGATGVLIFKTETGPSQSKDLSLALQPDGRIVMGGCEQYSNTIPIALLRFNANGSPDNTFGQRLYPGPVNFKPFTFGAAVADVRSVLIQPAKVGGKIISGLGPLTRVWP